MPRLTLYNKFARPRPARKRNYAMPNSTQSLTVPARPNSGTQSYTAADFAHSPFVAFYEVTRACDLLCRHCRACAQPKRHPYELKTEQAKTLIEQFATFPKPPVLVFTGGDPMKRNDIYELVEHANSSGVTTAMTPSATPLVTRVALQRLKDAGLTRLAVSLDGADAATHDAFRNVPGSFARTLEILHDAQDCGFSLQINTTMTQRNVAQVDTMANLCATQGITLWSLFFLIPVGRGLAEQRLSGAQCEKVFAQLFEHSLRQPYGIKTTEAHHYRRFVLQQHGNPLRHPGDAPSGRTQRAPLGVNDGRGVMFVSHTGTIYPSGFMPINCGKFPRQSIIDIYQNSDLFRSLREPDRLGGKCGVCDYREICGGSRARAYAITRDPLAAEPDCIYQPPGWKETASHALHQ
jgi:radical SAM protein